MTVPNTQPNTSVEIRLASRPQGWPTAENFELAHAPVPEPAQGQVLVRNLVMSVDPYMRGRMNDVKSYVPPFQVGKALDGDAIGEVITSHAEGVRPGDIVAHRLGWREYAVVDATKVVRVDPGLAPINAYLSVLGMPGMTAYAGIAEVAEQTEGDVVFVSGAAGAVGALAGQIARLRGASRIIGSAGSARKVQYLTEELGFDAAFNYKDGPVGEQLRSAAPEGIDVYFDNVGGEHLKAAISSLNNFGRVAACGMISQYNNTEPEPGPSNITMLVTKRLRLRGFIVSDHAHLRDQFLADVGGWLREGTIRYTETVIDGLSKAPDAFLGLLRGENLGKMLVKIAD